MAVEVASSQRQRVRIRFHMQQIRVYECGLLVAVRLCGYRLEAADVYLGARFGEKITPQS